MKEKTYKENVNLVIERADKLLEKEYSKLGKRIANEVFDELDNEYDMSGEDLLYLRESLYSIMSWGNFTLSEYALRQSLKKHLKKRIDKEIKNDL